MVANNALKGNASAEFYFPPCSCLHNFLLAPLPPIMAFCVKMAPGPENMKDEKEGKGLTDKITRL